MYTICILFFFPSPLLAPHSVPRYCCYFTLAVFNLFKYVKNGDTESVSRPHKLLLISPKEVYVRLGSWYMAIQLVVPVFFGAAF